MIVNLWFCYSEAKQYHVCDTYTYITYIFKWASKLHFWWTLARSCKWTLMKGIMRHIQWSLQLDKATACQMLAKESHNKSLAQTMNPSKRYLKLGIIFVEIILTYFRKLLSSAFKWDTWGWIKDFWRNRILKQFFFLDKFLHKTLHLKIVSPF